MGINHITDNSKNMAQDWKKGRSGSTEVNLMGSGGLRWKGYFVKGFLKKRGGVYKFLDIGRIQFNQFKVGFLMPV